jgi:hypothetical protein
MVISWRSTPTGWTDCDKPDCDKPDCDTPDRDTARSPEHLSWTTTCLSQLLCAISSHEIPQAPRLCQSDSTPYHRTKYLPRANSGPSFQSSQSDLAPSSKIQAHRILLDL